MRAARLVLVSALAALVAAGCGGAPARTAPNGLQISVIDQACHDRIKPLYDTLREMESRLNVGLNKAAYAEKLGDVRVVYDAAIRVGSFEAGACIESARKLETAMNQYITANNDWGDCITRTGCDVDTQALPGMRNQWSAATRLLDEVAIAFP